MAGLAHRHHHRPLFDQWVPVAELTRVLGGRGHLANVFHQIPPDHGGVQRRALPGEQHPARLHQVLAEGRQPAEHDLALVEVHAPAQRVAQSLGLLEDLLLHEVGVRPQFDLLQIEFELHDLGRHFDIVNGAGPEALARDLHDVVVIERHRLGRVRHDRGRVAGDNVLAAPDADDQRRTLAGAHQHARLLFTDHADGVGARDLTQRYLHRVLKVAFVQLAHEHRQHFGVRLGVELVPLLLQVGPQGGVVFDDAVVHQADARAVIPVRVGVRLGDAAVRRPARVGHSE